MDLFFECVVDHLKCIFSDHGSLVNDNGIVLPDVIVDHVLLVRCHRDVEKRVDSVSLQIGVELLPVVCCKKTPETECLLRPMGVPFDIKRRYFKYKSNRLKRDVPSYHLVPLLL